MAGIGGGIAPTNSTITFEIEDGCTIGISNLYLSVEVDGSKSCSNCCVTCAAGNRLSQRLTC